MNHLFAVESPVRQKISLLCFLRIAGKAGQGITDWPEMIQKRTNLHRGH